MLNSLSLAISISIVTLQHTATQSVENQQQCNLCLARTISVMKHVGNVTCGRIAGDTTRDVCQVRVTWTDVG